MDLEVALDLVDHVVERARLVATAGLEGVAVHRIAHPHDGIAARLDLLHDRRQCVAHLGRAHAGDQAQPAGHAVGVEHLDRLEDLLGRGGGADLHADGIANRRGEVHVRPIELARALPHPQEVAGHVVGQTRARVDAREGPLIIEAERLVRGVELDALELLRVGAAGLHEGQRAVDVGGETVVELPGRRLAHEVLVPRVHLAQVGVATLRECTDEVECRAGGVVGAHHARGVGATRRSVEGDLVDGIAEVAGQFDPVADLGGLAARLEVLTRDATHLDDREGCGVGEHDRHLQHRLEAGADRVGRVGREGLGAVAAREHEGVAQRGLAELLGEGVALAGENQRGLRAKVGQDEGKGVLIGPLGLLPGRQIRPGDRGHASKGTGRGDLSQRRLRPPRSERWARS